MFNYGENTMFGLFKSNPEKQLQREYGRLLERGMQFQRKGDIKSYSMITAEAEEVRQQLEKLRSDATA